MGSRDANFETDQETLLRAVVAERAKVLALIRSIVRRRDVAEDLFQDLCVLAIQKREEIVDAQHLAGWLRTAARHLAMGAVRKAARRDLLLGERVHDLLEPHWAQRDAAPAPALADSLAACIALLKPNARRIVEFRYVQGLGCAEVAGRLNRPVSSLYVTLSRIHKQLAECVLRRVALQGGTRA